MVGGGASLRSALVNLIALTPAHIGTYALPGRPGQSVHNGGQALAEPGLAIVPRDIRMMFQR